MSVRWDGRSLNLRLTLSKDQLLEGGYCCLAIALGAVQAWRCRYWLSTEDAVSYLDIGDAYVQGRWRDAINGYWNPLYSWILGVVLAIVRPSARLEYPTAKFVDFTIFLICLLVFRWFLKHLRLTYRTLTTDRGESSRAIPDWVWIVAGYTVFLWSSLRWITLTSNTPDMCGAALCYLAWGLLLRLEQRERRSDYALLGAVLALGYFARTPMFIVGWVMLLAVWYQGRTLARRRGVAVAALVLLVLTSPFIAAVSLARGHLTIGDNGKLNHAWLTNPGDYIIPDTHWQGGPPGYGHPRHPTRLLWNTPRAFEFAAPVDGTYPPWTDPSYWYEGLGYRFDGAAEWKSLKSNVRFYDQMFGRWLLLSLGAALLFAGDFRRTFRAFARNARYWLPAAAGLGLYLFAAGLRPRSLLPTQSFERYVATFAVLVCLLVVFSLRLRPIAVAPVLKRGLAVGLAGISVGLMVTLAADGPTFSPRQSATPAWLLSQELQETGVAAGMRVAIIGTKTRHAPWARLVRARIVAQVPDDMDFWRSPVATRELVLQRLAQTGAELVVSSPMPDCAQEGWVRTRDAEFAVHPLEMRSGAEP